MKIYLKIGFALGTLCSGNGNADPIPPSVITILVNNESALPQHIVTEMESEAQSILAKAGVLTDWIDCFGSLLQTPLACKAPAQGTTLLLRIIPDCGGHCQLSSNAALGVALVTPSGGNYATLLMDRLLRTASTQSWLVSLAGLLGYAAAHEVGHLLIGSNAHSQQGLMKAYWETRELHGITMRQLFFSEQEGQRMRANIRTRLKVLSTGIASR